MNALSTRRPDSLRRTFTHALPSWTVLELVVGEGLDPGHERGTTPEACPDLCVGCAVVPPAEHSSLQRAQSIVGYHRGTGRPREPGHGVDPTDHLRTAAETAADLDVPDAFGDQSQHQAFDRTQEWTRLDHCGDRAV